jgi:hypothetical protein
MFRYAIIIITTLSLPFLMHAIPYIDGWVYTNDVWGDPSPVPYSVSGGNGGSVTRRRRWVRRIWFDGSAEGGKMVW